MTISRLLKKARCLTDRIEHYNAYAGPNGFVQAQFPMDELPDLMRQANSSSREQMGTGFLYFINQKRKTNQPVTQPMRVSRDWWIG